MTGKTETPDLFMDLFRKMQGAAASYIEPAAYHKRAPSDEYDYERRVELPAHNHTDDMKWAIGVQRGAMFIGDIIHMLDGPEQRAAEADRNKPAPLSATVKSLEFLPTAEQNGEIAVTLFGHYAVWEDRWQVWIGGSVIKQCYADNLEANKAGAQADYERRILSAIQPAPAVGSNVKKTHIARAEALRKIANILDGVPEYHKQGMGCGLEDRNITDRYEAMEFGWEQAMERVYDEHINDARTIALAIQPAPLATQCEAGCVRYDGGEVRHLPECTHYAESRTKMFDDAVAENARLREALEPFSIALHIAQQACGVRMNVGYVETVAKLHIDHAHLVDAQEAMAGGET